MSTPDVLNEGWKHAVTGSLKNSMEDSPWGERPPQLLIVRLEEVQTNVLSDSDEYQQLRAKWASVRNFDTVGEGDMSALVAFRAVELPLPIEAWNQFPAYFVVETVGDLLSEDVDTQEFFQTLCPDACGVLLVTDEMMLGAKQFDNAFDYEDKDSYQKAFLSPDMQHVKVVRAVNTAGETFMYAAVEGQISEVDRAFHIQDPRMFTALTKIVDSIPMGLLP